MIEKLLEMEKYGSEQIQKYKSYIRTHYKELFNNIIFYDINNSWFECYNSGDQNLNTFFESAKLNINKGTRISSYNKDTIHEWILDLLILDNPTFTIKFKGKTYSCILNQFSIMKEINYDRYASFDIICEKLKVNISYIMNDLAKSFIKENLSFFTKILVKLNIKELNFGVVINTNNKLQLDINDIESNIYDSLHKERNNVLKKFDEKSKEIKNTIDALIVDTQLKNNS